MSMKKMTIGLGLWTALFMLPDGSLHAATPRSETEKAFTTITGKIDRIDGGMIFLEPEEGSGKQRMFSLNKAKEEGLRNFNVGDRVTVELDRDNLIVDIYKGMPKSEPDAAEMTR
ncbi:hypothetical protein [Candidatus Manganitrophus noduliformans]|uniref:DUF5666 domain-containing protein n=1 Tax=Candidatus Manganitrophus noduliformans TaxID=2606439 RepID=A0A7X6DTW8_9BACT|nr:hypothetical protein [Candidatus Manganitrophus noduliformans]NKE73340.1 hypothetical protein [Candidatus Manganitrophus noduliformans]